MGKFPVKGPFGDELDPTRMRKGGKAMTHKYALVECRGDWKWHFEFWGLARSYKSIQVCFLCNASKRKGQHQ